LDDLEALSLGKRKEEEKKRKKRKITGRESKVA
jgi:hypothetical protein